MPTNNTNMSPFHKNNSYNNKKPNQQQFRSQPSSSSIVTSSSSSTNNLPLYSYQPKEQKQFTEPPQFKIFTCGYGSHQQTHTFIQLLTKNNIHHLIDIRIRPHCGYNQGFSNKGLEQLCLDNKIKYDHYSELGNIFRDVEEPNANVVNSNAYCELLQNAGELLTRRLRLLIEKNNNYNVAIMCACSEVKCCHRNTVATYLHSEHNYKNINI
ncbi:hypothetical protein ABK040_010903 [Willaertia magna]